MGPCGALIINIIYTKAQVQYKYLQSLKIVLPLDSYVILNICLHNSNFDAYMII